MNGAEGGGISLLINAAYLVAAVLFIVGLKLLSSAATARRGNVYAAGGMLVAVVATLLSQEIVSFTWILIGLVLGAAIGVFLARTVQMTSMPQMVALLNGFGGAASALVAGDEYLRFAGGAISPSYDVQTTIMLSVLIGGLTFSGSMIAWAKLQEVMTGRPITYPG
ncbi:MAG: NAD(P)(+) transhydrogenase (Re/Si-specific) subunit beta, partial [Longimicrobiales bacterium]